MRWRTLRYLLTARCEDATRAASDECDGVVSPVDRWAARLHRLACAPCRRTQRQIVLVERLIRSIPEEFQDRIDEHEGRLSLEAARQIHETLADARRE